MEFASNYILKARAGTADEEEIFSASVKRKDKKKESREYMDKKKKVSRSSSLLRHLRRAEHEPEPEPQPESDSDRASASGSESEDEVAAEGRRVRKADTNVVAVTLGRLAEDADLFTGEPTLCSCGAVFSLHSPLAGHTWTCEYCGAASEVAPDERPDNEIVDYILEQGPAAPAHGLTVLLMDTSGSMCVTEECAPGTGASLRQGARPDLAVHNDGSDQVLPGERRGTTYISRLQGLQAAAVTQLQALAAHSPEQRVLLLTFASEVVLHGPAPVTLAGDLLLDEAGLRAAVAALAPELRPVRESLPSLTAAIMALEEGGQTALGPALLAGLVLASRNPAAQLLLCTDGKANVGLGPLDTPADIEASTPFYQRLTSYAREIGAVVNVLSIKGTDAVLETLAAVAAATRGSNDIVAAQALASNFTAVLANAVVATQVQVEMRLAPGLTFRNEPLALGNLARREIGNATVESNITFEFVVAESHAARLPFQMAIRYRRPRDRALCLRTYTQVKEVTEERAAAEAAMNVKVVGLHAAQQAAQLAADGHYTKARMKQRAAFRMVKRNLASADADGRRQYSKWKAEATKLDTALYSAKAAEEAEVRERYHSDEEDYSDDEMYERKKERKARGPSALEASRQRSRWGADTVSNALYQAANPMYSNYL